MRSPFDLPELRYHVALLLNQHEWTVCARVSRDWNQTFEELLWKSLFIQPKPLWSQNHSVNYDHSISNNDSTHSTQIEISHEALSRRSDLIRKLVCSDRSTSGITALNEDSFVFRNLKQLEYPGYLAYGPPHQHYLSLLLHHQSTLTHLTICLMVYPKVINIERLWAAAAACPLLKNLTVERVSISSQPCWKSFCTLWSLPHLTCLRLRRVSFGWLSRLLWRPPTVDLNTNNAITADDTLNAENMRIAANEPDELKIFRTSHLKELEFTHVYHYNTVLDLSSILRRCPNLENFLWSPNPTSLLGIRRQLGVQLAEYTQCCPKLVQVAVKIHAMDLAHEVEEEAILPFIRSRTSHTPDDNEGLPPLEGLSLSRNWFGERSWRLIRDHHGSTLRTLELRNGATLVTGSMIQEILCGLPRLEVFAAPCLRDIDILNDPRPWVCLGLIDLTLGFEFLASRGWLQQRMTRSRSRRMIFERLGTLMSLRRLTMTTGRVNPGESRNAHRSCHFLKFRLENGLGSLQTLRRLEGLSMVDIPQKLAKQDVQWMLESWPRLKFIFGTLHPDLEFDSELRIILEKRNVYEWSMPPSGVSIA